MTAHLDTQLGHDFATSLPEMALDWAAVPVEQPRLLVLNEEVALDLDLDPDWLRTDEGVAFLVGNNLPPAAKPVAQGYAGHQFGGFSPRLGDGRALLLGELRRSDGSLADLHLKGSGRTPFSRGGDGLAAVGPMLREYVIGEAMHALGIPTTRALAVVGTGTTVHRDPPQPGGLLARVAASHLRVGSFQYARVQGDPDDTELLRRLTEYAIARHYPAAEHSDVPALALLEEVVAAQAKLVAQWMLVGFIHGVMNTDNMTISGETIDYGPCAFMEQFDPATVFSSIDHGGRYAWGQQPVVAEWNLARFAETLLPLIDARQDRAIELATAALSEFRPHYSAAWGEGLREKLGTPAADDDLLSDLLALMKESRVDFTSFFSALTRAASGDVEAVRREMVDLEAIDAWLDRWRGHSPDPALMARANPIYVPRNHLVEEALAAATGGDLGPVERLVEVVSTPFTPRKGCERYAEPAPVDYTAGYQTFCGT